MDLRTLESLDSWAWPDGADQYLMAVLRDRSSADDDALLAAELAGDFSVASDAMADTLTLVLGDATRSLPLRLAAAASLGPMLEAGSDAAADIYGYDDVDDTISPTAIESVQESLRALYDAPGSPEQLRRAVLEASVRDPRDWHDKAVRDVYDHPAEASLVTAMFCMGYVRGFDAQILEGLRHPNEDVRYHAVVAAGNAGLPEAWQIVVDLAERESGDKSLRLAAIDAVAAIRPEEAYEALHGLLDHEDHDIAAAARDALVLAAAVDLEADDGAPADETDVDDASAEDDSRPPRVNGHHRG